MYVKTPFLYESYLSACVANISMVDEATITRLVCGEGLHDETAELEDERHGEVETSPLYEDVHTAVSRVRLAKRHVHDGWSGNRDVTVVLHVHISAMRLEYSTTVAIHYGFTFLLIEFNLIMLNKQTPVLIFL